MYTKFNLTCRTRKGQILSITSWVFYVVIKQIWSLELNCHSNILLVKMPCLQNLFPSGAVSGHQLCVSRTAFLWSQLQYRRSASGKGSTRRGHRHWRLKKKTTETETRSPQASVFACAISRQLSPGKILMPTNQIRAIPARARVPRELRARALGHLGVYKEGRVVYRAIPVRVS